MRRVSLKTLMVAVAGICIPLAWLGGKVTEGKKEQEAARILEGLLAVVDFDYEVDEGGGLTGANPPQSQWLRNVFGDFAFQDVVAVKFVSKSPVTNADLSILSDLPALRDLTLADCEITDAGLSQVGRLKSLQVLSVRRCQVSDRGLPHLRLLHNLLVLELDSTSITDQGLIHLTNLRKLRSLSMTCTQLTDSCIPEIAQLSELRFLDVRRTGITRGGIKRLRTSLPRCHILADLFQ